MKYSLVYAVPKILILTIILVSSCKKKDGVQPSPEPQSTFEISGIVPDKGPHSSIVIINGSGFSSTPSMNMVKFNGKDAIALSASATQLTVEVPKGAGTGLVTIQAGSKTATGPVFNYVFKITVSTVSGNGSAGYLDGNAASATFNTPTDVAVDSKGNLFVSDGLNHCIRKITPLGVVETLAGSGNPGFVDGIGKSAKFNYPEGLIIDGQDNIYVADADNHSIRKITPDGIVTTIAGDGIRGFKNGHTASSRFNEPVSLAIEKKGTIYVSDYSNHCIRKITQAGEVSTVAGNGLPGFEDGQVSSALFYNPKGIHMDTEGNIYVADLNNYRIRKISATGIVTTIAGTGRAGYIDGKANSSLFHLPSDVVVDVKGNIYVADFVNSCIRKITQNGMVPTIAGNGSKDGFGFVDGDKNSARFNLPWGIAIDAEGAIYVADLSNNSIRKIIEE